MAYAADHAADHHDHKPNPFWRWFGSTNHKDIGTLYLVFSVITGIIGAALSVVMRMELSDPGVEFLVKENGDPNGHFWNTIITAHGVIMIFFVVMPALIGGSVIIEVIFGIPGMGSYMFSSILQYDYNAVMVVLLISSFLTLVGMLLADLSYALVDPRITFD